ncbi:MAG: alanine racemase [Candidatus Fermentibacterota bacterium]
MRAMAEKARRLGLGFRPHFKTHQSLEVGGWFRDAGVRSIAVSSLEMARYFISDGWSDITLAIPLNPRQLSLARELCARAELGFTVDSEEALRAIGRMGSHRKPPVWLELDCGDGRTGVRWDDGPLLERLAETAFAEGLRLAGVLSHAGQTYAAAGPSGVLEAHGTAMERLETALEALGDRAEGIEVSWGDTPSCRLADGFGPATELRPGNFVFFDLMQLMLGSCSPEEIAVSVLCPVISSRPAEGRAVLYGGAVHLSKEYLTLDGTRVYGALASPDSASPFEPDLSLPLVRLSQEHGVVGAPGAGLRVGDLVSVVPVHSCLACDLYSEYMLQEGGGVGRMASCRAGGG